MRWCWAALVFEDMNDLITSAYFLIFVWGLWVPGTLVVDRDMYLGSCLARLGPLDPLWNQLILITPAAIL